MPKSPLLLVLLAVTALFAADSPKPVAAPLGRFQLVPATIDIGTKQGGSIESKFIFRIDTATGDVSYFHMSHTTEGEALEFWKPIPASLEQVIKQQKEMEAVRKRFESLRNEVK